MGKTTYITPMFIRYGRYPGSWIRKLPPTLAYPFVMVHRANFRRGAIVVIGKPIPISEFPMVLAIFVGQRSSGGYNVTISNVAKGTAEGAPALIVSWFETRRAGGAGVTNAMNAPYTIVKVSRSRLPVHFQTVEAPVL